jgi:class 3 adenylate cyclase
MEDYIQEIKSKDMELTKSRAIEAFAMVVDINSFTPMVSKAAAASYDSIAQFVRDVLSGAIDVVEKNDGEVVSFMGDAFLAVMENAESVYMACIWIAKNLDRVCEYISNQQSEDPNSWNFARGGPGLKIGIEYGWIDISTISCKLLGEQRLLIGPPINYASRIASCGEGNRCNVGPEAMDRGINEWSAEGPYSISGKHNKGDYTYWVIDLGDIWREGVIEEGEDTYWG